MLLVSALVVSLSTMQSYSMDTKNPGIEMTTFKREHVASNNDLSIYRIPTYRGNGKFKGFASSSNSELNSAYGKKGIDEFRDDEKPVLNFLKKKYEASTNKYNSLTAILFFDKNDSLVCKYLLGKDYNKEWFRQFLNAKQKPLVGKIRERHSGVLSQSDANRWQLESKSGRIFEYLLGDKYTTIKALKKDYEKYYDFTGCKHIKPKAADTGCNIQ